MIWRTQQEVGGEWSVYEGEGYRKGPFRTEKGAIDWLASNAGDLGAGVSGAGVSGLVVPTPDMRRQACAWLKDKEWATAQRHWIDSLYCAQQPGAREIDHVIAWQSYETLRMLLWVAQCTGLVEIADDMQREMTLDSDDQVTLRHAQSVAEARFARLTQRDRAE